jgi:hypothetical protein
VSQSSRSCLDSRHRHPSSPSGAIGLGPRVTSDSPCKTHAGDRRAVHHSHGPAAPWSHEPGVEPGHPQARLASTGATVTRMTTRTVKARGIAAPAVRGDQFAAAAGWHSSVRCDAVRRDGTTARVGPIGVDIAERLVVSPATARTYVSRALCKLHTRGRARLVTLAYESRRLSPRRPA